MNCVELMPIYEFDEFENSRVDSVTGERLMNYWGYSTVGFFAPKAGYAATGKVGMHMDELKTLIKELHRAGIEVILDVVFNHTAEGNEQGPTISFRGIDNQTYYMLTPEGFYYNFSGCGNTLNCNNPVVRAFVLDCLRYWAAEFHIDGFRFDLASILGRDANGAPLANPPLLESLAFDPILSKCKLIAEAWDAGGLYQVGSFPAYGRWAEWNGKYRDDMRQFLKGDLGYAGAAATRIQGSPDLYQWNGRGPTASINFITCHDGFTLNDLVSYNEKHNEANAENNNDGANDNESWNCGWEGASTDPAVNTLRRQQMKNAMSFLLLSFGVPMILAGDEMARTQYGNNNNYCHDTALSWIDWTEAHAKRRHASFLQKPDRLSPGASGAAGRNRSRTALFSFHAARAHGGPDFSDTSRVVAVMFDGSRGEGWPRGRQHPLRRLQHVLGNTAVPASSRAGRNALACGGQHRHGDAQRHFHARPEPLLDDQSSILVGARSSMILIAK